MPKISVKIEGLDRLQKAFRKSPVLVARELNEAIRRTIILLQGASIPYTPIDTGFLRRSTQPFYKDMSGELVNTAPYAIFVHDGTSKMKARPFFKDALDQSEAEVQSVFKKALDSITFKLATL